MPPPPIENNDPKRKQDEDYDVHKQVCLIFILHE